MIPKSLSIAELLAENPTPIACIVEDFLPVGGLSLLVAHPKAGKSTFARNLMCDVGLGKPFLGRHTTQVPIVYLALEEPKEHVAHEFRLLGADVQPIYTRVGHIPKPQVAEVLTSDIIERGAGLAILDPLFDALSVDDANSYNLMNEAMKELLYIARKTGCHIMALHHTNKGGAHGGLSVLGSQATSGATDHNAFLTMRRDGTRLFESQARVGVAFELAELGFDPDTHRLWIAEEVAALKQSHLTEELLEALASCTLTTTDWRSRVRGRNSDKSAAIHKLEADGRIVRINNGRHTFWKRSTHVEQE
jgi:hypothetical protein